MDNSYVKKMAVAGLHKASLDSYINNKEKSTTRTSSIRKMWQDLESEGKCESIESEDTNEIENECPQNQNQVAVHNNGLCLQRSPSLDVPAKERVRKVFHDWGSKSFEGHTLYSSRMNNCPRAESVFIRRIYGRQAVLDLLAKFVKERKTEVEDLLKNQFVSNFPHRPRIQSLLKGRFLRNQRFVEDQKQASVAASELGLLRQTHSVSDIRKGFLSKLNNYDKNASEVNDNIQQAEEIIHEIGKEFETNNLTSPQQFSSQVGERHDDDDDDDDDDDFIMQYEERDDSMEETNQITHHAEFPQGSQVDDEVVRLLSLQTSTDSLNWQEISQAEEDWDESVTEEEEDDNEWHHLTRTNSDEGIDVNSPVRSDSQEWIETLESRSNAFYWFDDDDNNDSRLELTQLTNRRTVSNLLQSDFGARLNHLLMQSYVNRQNQAFESQNEAVDSSSVVIPQTEEEREIINGLRVDMDALQERMNEMQRMLEACVDMQKSVHQELNLALNQSSSCYLCCDDGFESLPEERSGAHMCICSKCAQKINWSKLKESVSVFLIRSY
ncbi:unnamed protein product [Lactuca virosa]|uniref:Uncharacterized protein n=1 Tax=Lactuca virosa TaxID=75947 RepID=A0AAU9NUI8_9ASTR|nr:unnamed protein product [Lactuca virosa]